MFRARIPHQNGLFLHGVAALTVGGAGVDGVLEVDAFADGVAFDHFVAHFQFSTLIESIEANKAWKGKAETENGGEMWEGECINVKREAIEIQPGRMN